MEIEKRNEKRGVVIREDKYGIEVLTMRNGFQWSGMLMDAELIDMLEQAIVEFKRTQASPASVPGWKLVPDVPTSTMVLAGEKALSEHDFLRMDSAYCAMLASAPTPPVSEDRKDAERYHKLANYMIGTRFDIDDALVAASSIDEISSILDAMQEDKP